MTSRAASSPSSRVITHAARYWDARQPPAVAMFPAGPGVFCGGRTAQHCRRRAGRAGVAPLVARYGGSVVRSTPTGPGTGTLSRPAGVGNGLGDAGQPVQVVGPRLRTGPGVEDAVDEHQVPLARREDRPIPVQDVQWTITVGDQGAGVDVGVADDVSTGPVGETDGRIDQESRSPGTLPCLA